ncbi:hypothetical protein PUN28_013150 [Cardiocondyla obscurior]|uniref:Uncharacterized protein n=1 Tax=Cardiocondyla obscurior TaxID=286306 RepID=A0AAW2FA96_9HYME
MLSRISGLCGHVPRRERRHFVIPEGPPTISATRSLTRYVPLLPASEGTRISLVVFFRHFAYSQFERYERARSSVDPDSGSLRLKLRWR